MLRTLLITTALLAASGSALAHDNYDRGRVVSVEPQFVVSFGTRHHDGFRVLYESDGSHYWTHTRHHPGRAIVLPPSHSVTHVYRYRDDEWGSDNRRGWNDRQDWYDGRREHRGGERGYRNHRRHAHH